MQAFAGTYVPSHQCIYMCLRRTHNFFFEERTHMFEVYMFQQSPCLYLNVLFIVARRFFTFIKVIAQGYPLWYLSFHHIENNISATSVTSSLIQRGQWLTFKLLSLYNNVRCRISQQQWHTKGKYFYQKEFIISKSQQK